MTDTAQTIDQCIEMCIEENNACQLMACRDLDAFISKLDPDLCYWSGVKHKSALEDCGVSVDGKTKGNGWKIRIQWEQETHLLWSPNLRALLEAALRFLKDRVKE
jgi:hypothetical protein